MVMVIRDFPDLSRSMLQKCLEKRIVFTFLHEDGNDRYFMPLVLMHQMQFHRIVPMIYCVFARSMEMELFKQVKILVEHDRAVLIKMGHRLAVFGVTRLSRFRNRFHFLQRMSVVDHMERGFFIRELDIVERRLVGAQQIDR